MIDQDAFETHLLLLFENPQTVGCFFIISAIIFEVDLFAPQVCGALTSSSMIFYYLASKYEISRAKQ